MPFARELWQLRGRERTARFKEIIAQLHEVVPRSVCDGQTFQQFKFFNRTMMFELKKHAVEDWDGWGEERGPPPLWTCDMHFDGRSYHLALWGREYVRDTMHYSLIVFPKSKAADPLFREENAPEHFQRQHVPQCPKNRPCIEIPDLAFLAGDDTQNPTHLMQKDVQKEFRVCAEFFERVDREVLLAFTTKINRLTREIATYGFGHYTLPPPITRVYGFNPDDD